MGIRSPIWEILSLKSCGQPKWICLSCAIGCVGLDLRQRGPGPSGQYRRGSQATLISVGCGSCRGLEERAWKRPSGELCLVGGGQPGAAEQRLESRWPSNGSTSRTQA